MTKSSDRTVTNKHKTSESLTIRDAEVARAQDVKDVSKLVKGYIEDETIIDAEASFWGEVFAGLGLKYRYKRFVMEYLANGGNGTRAWMVASPDVKETSAATSAKRLLRNVQIQKAMDRATMTLGVTEERVVKATAGIAFNGEEESTKDRINALKLLGKFKGMEKSIQRKHVVNEHHRFGYGWNK